LRRHKIMKPGKLTSALRSLAIVAAIAVPTLALSQETTPPPPPAESTQLAPAPAPKPFEEIVKLWKGNLSEEFIKRKIETEGVIYQLSADDIIKCKAANVPESIIEAMAKTAVKQVAIPGITAPPSAAAPTAAGVAAPVVAAVPGVPAPTLAAQADRFWDGLVRRNSGVVLFKSRWDAGRLGFKEEKLTWLDAKDEKKNLILPASGIKEQFLVCLKSAAVETDCFEWGVKTEDGEYRFRDVGWQRANSPKPQELFDFMKAIYPNLVSAKYPADKK
jgi:hypothetical protein